MSSSRTAGTPRRDRARSAARRSTASSASRNPSRHRPTDGDSRQARPRLAGTLLGPVRPRGVAQLGSAPALGAGGRGFKSRLPDVAGPRSPGSRILLRSQHARDRPAADCRMGTRRVAPVELVRPGLWSIPVPLPNNPLRYVLVYVLELTTVSRSSTPDGTRRMPGPL